MVTRNNNTDIDKLNSANSVKKLIPKGTKFAVIASLVEQSFTGAAYVCVGEVQLSVVGLKGVIAKASLTDVSVKLEHGQYVIYLPDRAFILSSLCAIASTHNFASRVAGIDGGVSPLLNALSSGGASVRGISGAKYYILAVVLAFVFILSLGLIAYITLS